MSKINKHILKNLEQYTDNNNITQCSLHHPNQGDSCICNQHIYFLYDLVKKKSAITNKKDTEIFKEQIIKQLLKEIDCSKYNKNEKEICIFNKFFNKKEFKEYKYMLDKDIFKPYQCCKCKDGTDIIICEIVLYQFQQKYKNLYTIQSNIDQKDNKQLNKIEFYKELSNNSNNPKYKKQLIDNGKLKYFATVISTFHPKKKEEIHHGLAIFCDFSTKGTNNDPWTIEYFDSGGYDLDVYDYKQQYINYWYKQIINIQYKLNKVCKFIKVTNIHHQQTDTSTCGIFALYYIMCRIEGIPMSYFNNPKRLISYEEMKSFGKLIFRTKK